MGAPGGENLLRPPFLFLCFQLCSLDFHCLGPLGSPPLLSLIFLSFVWFLFLDFLIILFDFVDLSIDVHDLGDVLEAQKIQKQVPKTCVSFREF